MSDRPLLKLFGVPAGFRSSVAPHTISGLMCMGALPADRINGRTLISIIASQILRLSL